MWATRRVVFDQLAVFPEVKSTPVWVVEHALLRVLGAGPIRVALHVGLERRMVAHDLQQFLPDQLCIGLQCGYPCERTWVKKRDRRQPGEQEISRLLDKRLLAPKHHIKCVGNARLQVFDLSLRKAISNLRLDIARIGTARLLSALHLAPEVYYRHAGLSGAHNSSLEVQAVGFQLALLYY